jgi:hypothetical protein
LARLLPFFSMSDIHMIDIEFPGAHGKTYQEAEKIFKTTWKYMGRMNTACPKN